MGEMPRFAQGGIAYQSEQERRDHATMQEIDNYTPEQFMEWVKRQDTRYLNRVWVWSVHLERRRIMRFMTVVLLNFYNTPVDIDDERFSMMLARVTDPRILSNDIYSPSGKASQYSGSPAKMEMIRRRLHALKNEQEALRTTWDDMRIQLTYLASDFSLYTVPDFLEKIERWAKNILEAIDRTSG